MTRPDASFIERLSRTLGSNAVIADDGVATYSHGARGRTGPADMVVVRPADTAEVAATVRTCATAGVAIVPQGGNTGLSGGTVSPDDRPSVTLSLSRMRTIEAVDRDRWTITAEAGVTIEALQEAAASVDRQFAPDWAARGTATLGGAIATDAGGNNVLRHGNFRDSVLGLEIVFADGRIWDGRRALRKDSSGYDLKHLFIGSEGTLGIVTSAVVSLVPATPHHQSALAAITGLEDLMPLLELAHRAAPEALTAFELLPEVGIERIRSLRGGAHPMSTRAEYYVLVKLASAAPVTDQLTGFLAAASELGLVVDAVVAATPDQEAALWELRDELSPTRIYTEYHEIGCKLDTAVPIDRIAPFVQRVHHLAAEIAPMALCYGFGHVGDGNIHMMVLPTDQGDVEAFLAVRPALEAAIDAALFELGGTLSAEHGLGLLLRDRVAPQKPAIEWELMRTVKSALDPHDLLNPGKMLPPG